MNSELIKWLSDYDEGKEVETVSMGGLGYGYEVAIQHCAVETIRQLCKIEKPTNSEDFSSVVTIAKDAAANELDKIYGFSGAQVGAAGNIAAVYWKQTPEIGMKKIRDSDPERILRMKIGETGAPIILNYKG